MIDRTPKWQSVFIPAHTLHYDKRTFGALYPLCPHWGELVHSRESCQQVMATYTHEDTHTPGMGVLIQPGKHTQQLAFLWCRWAHRWASGSTGGRAGRWGGDLPGLCPPCCSEYAFLYFSVDHIWAEVHASSVVNVKLHCPLKDVCLVALLLVSRLIQAHRSLS